MNAVVPSLSGKPPIPPSDDKKVNFFEKMERLLEVEHFLLTKWLTTRRLSRHGDFSESRATMVSYSDE